MNSSSPDCIFCKVVKKELPTKIIFENEYCVAFNDIKPVSPTHILVIPKVHIKNLWEVEDVVGTLHATSLLGKLLLSVKEIAKQENLNDGFRTVINTGDNGGQTVYHLHLHVLGGRFHKWPPG